MLYRSVEPTCCAFPRERSGKETTRDDVDKELACFGAKGIDGGDIGGDLGRCDASGSGELDFCLLIALA